MLDYEMLRIIWWVLLGVVLIGFAVTDGFDFGVAILLPVVAKTDMERKLLINSIGPTWEGNQVWFILGGGAIFAAWPLIYAVSFSGFYLVMFALLIAFILRPVAFKFRSKIAHTAWRSTWDSLLCVAGVIPPLVFGAAVGNVLQGVPFYFDSSLQAFYVGNVFELINPFALLCGVLCVAMFIMHGGYYLANKVDGQLNEKSLFYARMCAVAVIILFGIGGLWVKFGLTGYKLVAPIMHDAPSNPLHKQVTTMLGAWINNYQLYPWMLCAPLLGFIGVFGSIILSHMKYFKIPLVTSAIGIAGIIVTVGFSMFPFILPSSNQPSSSLLVWDASSSQLTLNIMLIVGLIFIPIILAYTTWVYRVMRGKITVEEIENDPKSFY